MPSEYQANPNPTGDFDTEAEKMLATKDDATVKAIVRGIRDPDRAREYIEAELSLADDEDRKPRKKLIGMLNRQVSERREVAEEAAAGG